MSRALRSLRHSAEYLAFLAVKGFVRLLPHPAARGLGRGLGRLAHALLRRHRRIAAGNLALALPDLGEADRRRTVAACFEHFGLALADAVSAARFDAVELCRRLDLEGWEHLQEAEREIERRGTGSGLFILSAHLGLWEIAAYPPGIYGGPLHVVGRPADNPWLHRELARARGRFGNELIPKRGAVRPMVRVLSRGGRVGILIDQRARPGEGIWVPFFGRPAYTTPVLARLALRTGAPVVAIFGYPLPAGRYRVVLREAIWPDAAAGHEGEEGVAELTRRYLEVCEREIRGRPEMWLWMHERWKRPDPTPSP
ncbi:MAG TPA: lysophospholipid acyltransferase family protein [Thermoanaerobaculia bacterium]|nr:lysophospholipid acyltransferase family protein [Thermoanaerobaculia bacterium]